MNFTPAPPNDFAEFIETYYERCRARVPEIEAIAGKWRFEDLIPGLSDFDVRFIVAEPMTADAWCRMAMEVAAVHLELARERKEWARTLEHLPGVNLSWAELMDETNYYPEFAQWTFYHGPAQRIADFNAMIDSRSWDTQEEAYHWKKVANYYGRYDRQIDLPINLGAYVDKYPLHSRLMHYFAPPVHSLVCLQQRTTTSGKLDAFRQALGLFSHCSVIEKVLDLIDAHYESPNDLTEPGQTALEDALEIYLREAVNTALAEQEWLQCPLNPSPATLKQAVREKTGAPHLSQLFELIKFARLMKGRLWFYAHDLQWFDSLPLIRIEVGRIRANFLEQPLRLYAALFLGQPLSADECLHGLEGSLLSHEQVAACRRFAALADPACPEHALKTRALEIVEIYESFLDAIDTVAQAALRQQVVFKFEAGLCDADI